MVPCNSQITLSHPLEEAQRLHLKAALIHNPALIALTRASKSHGWIQIDQKG
jgi:hypothetical protein